MYGTIQKISTIPDAGKSDYPDCYYSALLNIENNRENQKVVILIKCFENQKDLLCNRVKEGDKITASCIAFDDAPESMKQIQQSDQIEQFDLNYYFAENIRFGVQTSAQGPQIRSAAKSEFVPASPLSEAAKLQIQDFIQRELTVISQRLKTRKENILVSYPETVAKRIAQYRQDKDPAKLLLWQNQRLIRIDPAITTLSNGSANLDAVSVLTEFDRELKKRNIRFIFVSFPMPWENDLPYFSTNVAKEASFDSSRLKTVEALLQNGVETIELGHYFYETSHPFPFFTDVIGNDIHPVDYAIEILSEILKERLQNYNFTPYQYPDVCFRKIKKQFNRSRVFPDGNPNYTGVQNISDYIFIPPAGASSVKSPVFVVGDSFSVTPWGSSGLRGFLGAKMKILIDGYQNQSGSTRIARTISARKYMPLSGKQVVIMLATSDCFARARRWESLVKDEPKSNLSSQIYIDAANVPQSWKSCTVKNQRMLMKLTPNGKSFVSSYLKMTLPDKFFSIEGTVAVKLFSARTCIKIYDQNFQLLAASPWTDFSNDMDDIILPFAVDETHLTKNGNRIIYLQLVTSSARENIEIGNISVTLAENKKYLRGPGKIQFCADDLGGSGKHTLESGSIGFSGPAPLIIMPSKRMVVVDANRKISSTVKITNKGRTAVKCLYGLSIFDRNRQKIDNKNFPLIANGHLLTVVSAEEKIIVVDRLPKAWRKNVQLATTTSLSQVDFSPNDTLVGTIDNVTTNENGHGVIKLTKSLKKPLAPGTGLQINGIAGANLYFASDKIQPDEEKSFSFEVVKDEQCRKFSSKVLNKEVFFVAPIILFFSDEQRKNNIIHISDFQVKY